MNFRDLVKLKEGIEQDLNIKYDDSKLAPQVQVEPKGSELKKWLMYYTALGVGVIIFWQGTAMYLAETNKEIKAREILRDMKYIEYLKEEKAPIPTVNPRDVKASRSIEVSKIMLVINKYLKGSHGESIEYYSKAQGVDPLLIASIIKQETGNCSSNAYKTLHNVGGIMSKGSLQKFTSYVDSIATMCRIIKTFYYDEGKTSIAQIQKKYCPVGAENDPTGLNKHWFSNVTYYYNQMKGDM